MNSEFVFSEGIENVAMQRLRKSNRINKDTVSPRANMQIDVVVPTLLVAAVAFVAAAAAVSAVIGFNYWLVGASRDVLLSTLAGACGLALAPAMLLALRVVWIQLAHYREVRVQHWHFRFEEPDGEPQGARQMRQPPEMPNTWRVGVYSWNEGHFQRLVDKMFDQSGEWVGGPQVTRDVLKAVGMKRLTSAGKSGPTIFADIVGDMNSWGWIDDRNYWTPHGKESLWLEIHPPPWPGRSSSRPTWLDDDGRQE